MSVKKTRNPDKRAKLAEWIKKNKSTVKGTGSSEIHSAPEGLSIPLTHGQERLWFLQQLHPDNPFYHYSDIFEISGKLSLGRMQEAFLRIIQRHSILRTTFFQTEKGLEQVVQKRIELDWKLWDYQDNFEEELVRERVIQEVRKGFDLQQGPLLRVLWVRISPESHWMILSFHHMVIDERSIQILVKELAHYYQDAQQQLPEPLLQYKDFAYWQRKEQASHAKELTYWKKKLEGEAPILSLPTDFSRPPNPTFRGNYTFNSLSSDLSIRVEEKCKELGVTPFIFLLAVYKVLLHKYCKEEDIWIGSPFSNRDQVVLDSMMGFFNETQVLRTRLQGEMTFEDCVRAVKQTVLEAFTHKNMPFETLVSALNPERTLGINPLFQVMFLFQEEAPPHSLGQGMELSHKPFDYGVSKFDLTLMVSKKEEGLATIWEYSTELFKPETIDGLQESFSHILNQVCENAASPITELSIVSPQQEVMLREMGRGSKEEQSPYTSVQDLFQLQVETTPNKPAVSFQGDYLTYSELDMAASRLAGYLRKQGLGENTRIGLCASPSVAMIAGLMGIIRVGASYVPLDPSYPQERIDYMVREASIEAVVVEDALAGMFKDSGPSLVSLNTQIQHDEHLALVSDIPSLKGSQEVYTIFTSGSSGKPKGVPISHENLLSSTLARSSYYPSNPSAFLLLSSYSFDSSVAGIFWTLCTGGNLVLAEKRIEQDMAVLSQLIAEKSISHSLMLPSLYELLLKHGVPSSLHSLESIIVAGEACPSALVGRHFDLLPEVGLYNEYGPTEATVWCSVYPIRPGDTSLASIPIGKPIAQTDLLVLDAHQKMLPIGVEGELYVGGKGLASGYLERPDLTQKKFVDHPFKEDTGEKLYRTGDLVRWQPDGNLIFLGRIDNQVKIRGFRIELDEVTQQLKGLNGVEEALVLASPSKELVGYFQSSEPLNAQGLRRQLMGILPAYMVPSHFVKVDRFPKLPNGKFDTRKLPSVQNQKGKRGGSYQPAQTAFEKTMVEVWEKVLNKKAIGVNDNFFELGGDSLLSIHLLAEARKVGINLASTQLFESPTIAGLQQKIGGGGEEEEENGQAVGSITDDFSVPSSFDPEVKISEEEREIILRQLEE